MRDVAKIGVKPVDVFNGIQGLANGPSWFFSDLDRQVKTALDAGQLPLVTYSPWFPREWSGGQPAYEEYTNGCTSEYFAGVVRIHITDDDPRSPLEPGTPGTPGTPSLGATPPPDQDTPFARLANFYCKRGGTISVGTPGVMWRSPSGYFAGIVGGHNMKHGVLTGMQDKRPGHIDLDGSFTYTHDGSAAGDTDEITFFLIEIGPDGTPTYQQPAVMFTDPVTRKDAKIRFDQETQPFCRPGGVPHLDASHIYELGLRTARRYGSSAVYEIGNEMKFGYYWPARLGDDSDGQRYLEEVLRPFMRGVRYGAGASGSSIFLPEAAGPEDLELVAGELWSDIDGYTIHVYSWDDGASHKVTGEDWFGGVFRRMAARHRFDNSKLVLITETDKYDELLKLAQTDPQAAYVTNILGAGGQDGIAKAVVR